MFQINAWGRPGTALLLLLCTFALPLQAAETAPLALPVHVLTVERQDVPIEYEYAARTAGSLHVQVHARVQGTLIEQDYTDGQTVKKGQLLYRIDPDRYQAAVDQAKAELDMKQATLRQAQRDWDRVSRLYAQKAVSEKERDQSLSNLELAKAGVAASRANLKNANIDLDYTRVTASISGVTGERQQDIGSLVGNSASDSLLTTITQLDPIHVNFSMPDQDALEQRRLIASGKLKMPDDNRVAAQLELGDGRTYPLAGYVDFTDNSVDPDTGSVRARAIFRNPKHTLLPGQFIRVKLTGLIRTDAILVPQKAIMQMGLQPFIYVITDGKAQLRPVVLGPTVKQQWLIESGLDGGDTVIVDNLMKVRPGTPVSPLPPEKPAEASQTARNGG